MFVGQDGKMEGSGVEDGEQEEESWEKQDKRWVKKKWNKRQK